MSNAFQLLLHSKAFWTALIAVVSAVVMQYANVPQAIWIPIETLLGSIVVIFTGNEIGTSVGVSLAKAMKALEDKEK